MWNSSCLPSETWGNSDSFFLSWVTWPLMTIFLQGCWVYKMTGLCLPWTGGCPLLRSFQQSLGIKLWHHSHKASGETLRVGVGNPPGQEMLCHLVAESYGFDIGDLSWVIAPVRPQHIPRPGHALNRLWTPSDAHSPSGSGVTMLPGQQDRWNVARLLLWLHFPTPPYPTIIGHWHALSATLSFQWLVWGLSGSECGAPVPNPFFSGQVWLHFLWPYQTPCFQNCYSAIGKLNSISPSWHPPSWE